MIVLVCEHENSAGRKKHTPPTLGMSVWNLCKPPAQSKEVYIMDFLYPSPSLCQTAEPARCDRPLSFPAAPIRSRLYGWVWGGGDV